MLKPLTTRQQTMIINNVKKALLDINTLNKAGYNYLYLCSGFIAHYNIEGFKDYYSKNSLKKDLLDNKSYNTWNNFSSNYEYYMSKKTVYEQLLKLL